MVKKEEKILQLKKKYKGALAEFIYRWFLTINSETEDKLFWKFNSPEDVEMQLMKCDFL